MAIELRIVLEHKPIDNSLPMGGSGRRGRWGGFPDTMVEAQMSFYANSTPLVQWDSRGQTLRGRRLWTFRSTPTASDSFLVELDLADAETYHALLLLTKLDPLTAAVEAAALREVVLDLLSELARVSTAEPALPAGEISRKLTLSAGA